MKISDHLKEDMICFDLEATKKQEAIKELGNIINRTKAIYVKYNIMYARGITDYNMFLKDVLEREKITTTGIGNEVALPHARTNAVTRFIIALGRSEKGIEFESVDSKKVKLVFLMGTPKTTALNQYLVLLAHLTRLLNKKSFRESFLMAKKPTEIIEAFKKIEK